MKNLFFIFISLLVFSGCYSSGYTREIIVPATYQEVGYVGYYNYGNYGYRYCYPTQRVVRVVPDTRVIYVNPQQPARHLGKQGLHQNQSVQPQQQGQTRNPASTPRSTQRNSGRRR